MDDVASRSMRAWLGGVSALLPIGLLATDPDGAILFANQRCEDLCGQPGRSAEGRLWYEIAHPEEVRALGDRWNAGPRSRGHLGTFRCRSATGVETICRGEAVPVVDPDGVTGHLVMLVPADQAQPQLPTAPSIERLLDSSDAIITVLGADGNWRWSSGGALRLLGYQADFDASAGVFPLLHPDDVERAVTTFDGVVNGRIGPDQQFEFRIRAADGSWRCLQVSAESFVDDPSIRGVVVHAHDVTERRDLLEERTRLLEDLQRRAAQLSAESRRRQDLLAALYHELAHPLTVLSMYTEVTEQDLGDVDVVRAIRRAIDRLMRLGRDVAELLEGSVDQSVTAVKPADVAAVVRASAATAAPRAEEGGVELVVEVTDGEAMPGDADRIGQLVDNLLSNAIKFTLAGGRVVLSAVPERPGWRISCRDTGMGIPIEEQAKVFDQFFRGAGARESGIGGSGIGLSLVRSIAEAHGGSADLESRPGEGTTVTVRLGG